MSNPLYIDFAWTKPAPAAVKAAGYAGVIGYCSPDLSKNLTQAEAAAYQAQGLDVLLVWESTGTDPANGAGAGAADAAAAEAQTSWYPTDHAHPIFYATDFGPTTAQMSAVLAYYEGVAGAPRAHGFGPYGDELVVNTVSAARIGAVAFWQTVAWSGGQISSIANLYQRVSPTLPPIPGGGYDEDVLLIPIVGPAPPGPPIKEGDMPVSATLVWNTQRHSFQVSKGALWHKWAIGTPSPANESLATVTGETTLSFPDQTPQVAVITNPSTNKPELTVSVEDSTAKEWVFAQEAGAGTWQAWGLV
jgi:hypothetical protein